MALFAPVCPPRIYKRLFATPRMRGMYFLLLAHDIIHSNETREEYSKLFKNRMFPSQVHLDNSVIELGDSVSMEVLWDAADVVNANTIVLPDVLCKSQETIASTLKGYDDFQILRNTRPVDSRYPRNFMVIPQGESMNAWVRCLESIISEIGAQNIPWVGIPRNITGRIDTTRQHAIEAVQLLAPQSMIHLMGFSDNVLDDFRCTFMQHVAGIDSAVPMRFKGVFTVAGDPGKRGSWWDDCEWSMQMGQNVERVRDLILDHSGHVDERAFREALEEAAYSNVPKNPDGDTVN